MPKCVLRIRLNALSRSPRLVGMGDGNPSFFDVGGPRA